jgi:hypothetical protein
MPTPSTNARTTTLLEARAALAIGTAVLAAALPTLLALDRPQDRAADPVIAKLGVDDHRFLSETELEQGADRRWTFPRHDAAGLEPGDAFVFTIPGGRAAEMALVERNWPGAGALAFQFANVAEGHSATIVLRKGVVRGTVHVNTGGAIESWILETGPFGEEYTEAPPQLPCERVLVPGVDGPFAGEGDGRSIDAQTMDAGEGGVAGGDAGCADTGAIIDVLVAVTPAFRSGYATDEDLALAVVADLAEANAGLGNSLALPRYRAVDVDGFPFVILDSNGSGDLGEDLGAITSTDDGKWDAIHAVRDETRADLVALMTDSPGGGVAFLGVGNPAAGFATASGFGGYLLAHELGHTMGCCHAVGDGGGCDTFGFYTFSVGWRFSAGSGLYRTIMAYTPGERIGHFSNPLVTYLGEPMGEKPSIALGDQGADNARTHSLTARTVANYRCGAFEGVDCNANGIDDDIDIASGTELDCNLNRIPDSCDIDLGLSQDEDGDGVPDECPLTDVEISPAGVASLDTFGAAVALAQKPLDPVLVAGFGAPGVDFRTGADTKDPFDDVLVQNAGAAYVVPVIAGAPDAANLAVLEPHDPEKNAFFGRDLAILKRPAGVSGTATNPQPYTERNFAVVGAYRWPQSAQNGLFTSKGAIYLYAQDPGGEWAQVTSANGQPWRYTPPTSGGYASRDYALFGYSLDIGHAPTENSEIIVVGAPGRDGGKGAIYVVRNPPTGTPVIQTIRTITNAVEGDNFGTSVAVEDFVPTVATPRVAMIGGAPGRDGAKGAAIVYERAASVVFGTTWNRTFNLTPVGAGAPLREGERFGTSVDILTNVIAVGSPGYDEERGRVHFWERNTGTSTGTWTYRGWFSPATAKPGDRFGASVSLARSVVEPTEFIVSVGAPGRSNDFDGIARPNAGRVYVLRKKFGVSSAEEIDSRILFTPAAGDEFGYSVDAADGFSVGGAPFADPAGLNSGKARIMTTE